MEQSDGVRNDARAAVSGALALAILWVSTLGGYTLAARGLGGDFRMHLLDGLLTFCIITIVPLLLVLLTLNWIARRVAGVLLVFLFFGMAQGAASLGFGASAGFTIVFVCALLVGGMLFFLSRPSVMLATGDLYDFMNLSDVFSKYTFRRKPPH